MLRHTAASSNPRRIRCTNLSHWHGIIPLLYLLATLLLLWPLVAHLRSGVAETEGDPLLNAWTLRWVQHSLLTHPTHLYDGNMFAPNPHTLAFSELLLPQAIMAWPVWLVAHDGLLAYNLMVLVTYPLCAIAMYALCRGLGAARGAAFVAGLCYTFAPFRLDNTAHLQVLSMQWMPCAVLAVIRFMQRPTWWRAVGVIVATALVAFSSVYYAVMFGTGLAVFLLVEAVRQRRFFLTRTGVALVIALVITAGGVTLIDAPYLAMSDEQGIARSLDEAYDYAAHRASYLTAVPGSVIWSHLLPTASIGASALFPGALLTVFAVVGLRQIRRPWMAGLAALGLIGFVLSFGPTWGAKGTGWPLPYRLLYEHIILYRGLRGPDRFGALVLLALAVFAAVGLTMTGDVVLRAKREWLHAGIHAPAFAVLLAGLAIADTAVHLHPVVSVDQSPAVLAPYRWLAAQPETGIVAEFPMQRSEQRTAFYSTYHWRPVLWGHSGFIPTATYQLRGRFAGKQDFPAPENLDALGDMGVRTLLIHRSAYRPADLALMETGFSTVPDRIVREAQVGDSDIYALRPPELRMPFSTEVTYALSAAGNVDILPGQLTITNRDTHPRMLYTVGQPHLIAEFRDMNGRLVARRDVALLLPALINPGAVVVPFTVRLPTPATYALSLTIARLSNVAVPPPATVRVVSLTTLPHLTLDGLHVTSPPLYVAGESVAMWITTKGGKTFPLPDTMAGEDRTVNVTLKQLPPDIAQIVAHGKSSGIELWASPP